MKRTIVFLFAALTFCWWPRESVQAYYNPQTGRWFSRDPAGERSRATTYSFGRNNTLSTYDLLGLWGIDVHYFKTEQWAKALNISAGSANTIGGADNAVDSLYDPVNISNATWSWHFNRTTSADPSQDTRFKHRDDEVALARVRCTWSLGNDDSFNASVHLGHALHPLQDWVAHGDFNRYEETPSISINSLYYWHNWGKGGWLTGWWTAGQPDDPGLDANGVDGRATRGVMDFGTTLSNGDQIYWAEFHPGTRRIRLTEQLTKGLLADFQNYVRQHGKPCGECRKAFLGGN